MTARTIVTKFAAVRFVILMAFHTPRRRFAVFDPCFMAIAASDIEVPAREFEIGQMVIEQRGIQQNDIGVPSLVIGMAIRAVILNCPPGSPMKSLAAVAVVRDFLMAIQTKIRLRTFCERAMTFFTLIFKLRVSLNQRPRHQQAFDSLLTRGLTHHHGE